MFIQDRDSSLDFSWRCTQPGARLDTFVATNIELPCLTETAVGEGITLTEDQFEELQTVRQDISELVPQESAVEGTLNNGDSDSDDKLTEQIGQCNVPTLTRSSRRVRVPAKYHDFL